MKATRLRLVRPADAAEIVALTSSIDTVSLATPASFRSLLERPASPATERLVVEFDRRLVAWCPSGAHDDGQGWFWIGVDPACRGRGIGSMLFGRLEERLRALGASGLSTQANDDDGRRFLEAGGFRETNVTQVQALELGDRRNEPRSGCQRRRAPRRRTGGFAFVLSDREGSRALAEMTGVRPDQRRRAWPCWSSSSRSGGRATWVSGRC